MGNDSSPTVQGNRGDTASPILGAPRLDRDGNVKMSGSAYRQSLEKEARRLLKRGRPSELELESITRLGRRNSWLLNLLGVALGGLLTVGTTLCTADQSPTEKAAMQVALVLLFIAAGGLALALYLSDSAVEKVKDKINTKSDIDQMENILPEDADWPPGSTSTN